ncbi:hypothetical protein L226DRAFT_525313 [Lentinus tigrinus ALCF2SS1-7]|uniref:uncharacterized protein n=1 Tax=Lentinus tigrinus ALCF2SS1-7 TaxID=1328758 RepID=UPI0011661A20|nr:hypothetical protein L226DRAFT_525313 [Lentinus tigrinus ALCF2SS1-7]
MNRIDIHLTTAYVVPVSVWAGIDHVLHNRDAPVSRLCTYLKIPDPNSKGGLKKTHAVYEKVQKKLDRLYKTARERGDTIVTGCIISIWTMMCADSLLRDKLIESGITSKIIPILEESRSITDNMGPIALQALVVITQHGGPEARFEVARNNHIFIRFVRSYLHKPTIAELVMKIIAAATNSVLGDPKPNYPALAQVSIKDVLQVTIELLRHPQATLGTFNYGLHLLATTTRHCPAECRAIPSLFPLFAAFLRSRSVHARGMALSGFIRLPLAETGPTQRKTDPNRLIAAVRGPVPRVLFNLMDAYGLNSCESQVNAEVCLEALPAAMNQFVMSPRTDRDLCVLGETLAKLILSSEYGMAKMWFQDPRDGRPLEGMLGLPFSNWWDALPLCAKAIRARGQPGDLDTADVLELKYHQLHHDVDKFLALAEPAVARNPDLAFAQHALTYSADYTQSMRAMIRGLKCTNTTPYMRRELLMCGVRQPSQIGEMFLRDAVTYDMPGTEGDKRELGLAALRMARKNALMFMSEASPDSADMREILNWYILDTIALRGPELSDDLAAIQPILKKVETSTLFMTWLGTADASDPTGTSVQLILQFYAQGTREFSSVVARYDTLNARVFPAPPSVACSNDVEKFLEKYTLILSDHAHAPGASVSRPEISSVSLPRCSSCANPSSMLKKCGGCGIELYCGPACQKRHWKEHKPYCKPSNA